MVGTSIPDNMSVSAELVFLTLPGASPVLQELQRGSNSGGWVVNHPLLLIYKF